MATKGHMSISKRLITFTAAMLAVNSLIFGYNIYSVNRESKVIRQLEDAALRLQLFSSFSKEVLHTNLGYMDAIIDKESGQVDADIIEQHKHFHQWFVDNHNEMLRLINDPTEREDFKKSADEISAWNQAGEELFAAIGKRAPKEEFAQFDDVLDSTLDHIIERNNIVLAGARREFERLSTDARSANQLALMTQIFSLVLMLLVGFITTVFLSRSLKSLLLQVVENLRGNSLKIKGDSDAIAQTSLRLSDAANRQASGLQETVSSVEEISAMVERNSQSANQSTKASSRSQQAATRGKQMVEGMAQAIEEISLSNGQIMSQMEISNQEFSNIVQVIREIGEKTKVINDIVFQTRLLSFNASVEAARAGEHGKGFAVVAEEVGNLAAMSGRAASEITEMLDSSIKQVGTTVEKTIGSVDQLVRSAREKVSIGERRARECGETLDEILNNTIEVNGMVNEIMTASQEQSLGISEVNKAVQQLDETTHENVHAAQETTQMAESLRGEVGSLNRTITELMFLVGANKNGQVVHLNQPQPQIKKKRAGGTSGSGGPPLAKVISLNTAQDKTSKKVLPKEPSSSKAVGEDSEWKAAGSDISVPRSDDPRFDDV